MRDHYFIISLFNNDCVVPFKRDKIVCVEDYNNIESKRGFFGKIQHMYMKCYHNEDNPLHSYFHILLVIV